jgi:hypothetical protein
VNESLSIFLFVVFICLSVLWAVVCILAGKLHMDKIAYQGSRTKLLSNLTLKDLEDVVISSNTNCRVWADANTTAKSDQVLIIIDQLFNIPDDIKDLKIAKITRYCDEEFSISTADAVDIVVRYDR